MRAIWLLLVAAGCLQASPPQAAPAAVDVQPILVFATGGEHGSLEPCGCAQNQLGGLSRRATALLAERPDPAAALTLSCGGLVRSAGRLDALTLQTVMTALASMHYDAHVPSAQELRVGAEAVTTALAAGVPWLAANAQPATPDAPPFPPTLSKTIGRATVTVVGLCLPEGDAPAGWTLEDPVATLARVTPADGPLVIVLAGPLAAARAVAARAPARALVLVGDWQSPLTSRPVDGRVLATGDRAHVVLAADAARPSEPPRLIPLDESWPADPGVAEIVGLHRQRIVFEGLLDEFYERTDPPGGVAYVGSERCGSCHPSELEIWKGTRHAHAVESLQPEERQLDPDCLQCHTTGFGARSGYAGLDRTPQLARVGCEMCHGPGAAHVAEPEARKLNGKVQCLQCHDAENSPHFLRETYWPKIAHGK